MSGRAGGGKAGSAGSAGKRASSEAANDAAPPHRPRQLGRLGRHGAWIRGFDLVPVADARGRKGEVTCPRPDPARGPQPSRPAPRSSAPPPARSPGRTENLELPRLRAVRSGAKLGVSPRASSPTPIPSHSSHCLPLAPQNGFLMDASPRGPVRPGPRGPCGCSSRAVRGSAAAGREGRDCSRTRTGEAGL